jgi:AcrR family transcriptional regulator
VTAATVSARGKGRRGVDRTREVAAAALAAFCDGGFRLTQIAHVAERLGVSVGTIYRYVDSKEALFHLAVLESLREAPETLDAPLKVVGIGESAQRVRVAIVSEPLWRQLEAVLAAPPPADAAAEAREIAEHLYESLSRCAPAIRLLDRCAHEIPELAEIFDEQVRARVMGDLSAWVAKRGLADEAGTPSAAALARGALEAIAWLAKTRHGDPTATWMTEDQARAAAVRIFVNALAPGR